MHVFQIKRFSGFSCCGVQCPSPEAKVNGDGGTRVSGGGGWPPYCTGATLLASDWSGWLDTKPINVQIISLYFLY